MVDVVNKMLIKPDFVCVKNKIKNIPSNKPSFNTVVSSLESLVFTITNEKKYFYM